MEKQIVTRTVYVHEQPGDFTVEEILSHFNHSCIKLSDTVNIYVKIYSYVLSITRDELETDEEFEKRKIDRQYIPNKMISEKEYEELLDIKKEFLKLKENETNS